MNNVAFTFSGQGSQRPGMGRPWRDSPGWEFVGLARELTGVDVEHLLLDADQEELRRTDTAQLSTLVFELVVLAAVRAAGVRAGAVAGHSLGEYAALVAASVITPEAAIRLVDVRGRAMRSVCAVDPGTMAVVIGLPADQVERAARRWRERGESVWTANVNSATQVAISGRVPAVERLCSELTGEPGVRVVPIPVGGAFHTPLMRRGGEELARQLAVTEVSTPRLPVVANIDGRPHLSSLEWPALLVAQLSAPVRWHESMLTLHDDLRCRVFVEIGPAGVLTGLVRAALPGAARTSVGRPADLAVLCDLVPAA